LQGWLSQGGLPLGGVLLLSLLYASLRHRTGFKSASKSLPEVGEELGLSYTAPRYARSQGTLAGVYQGRSVRIDPDEQRAILVRFERPPQIDLRTYEQGRVAPRGMVRLDSPDPAFDAFWKTRFASKSIRRRVARSEAPSRLLEPFRGEYYRQLRSLSVTDAGVTCVLDFGNPPYIPADAVRALLPALSALADWVEQVSAPRASSGEAAAPAE
jgi:hypothetical protein